MLRSFFTITLALGSCLALAQSRPERVSVPAGANCTADVNDWNNPSGCECPMFYNYNEEVYSCDLVKSTAPDVCSPDVNQWGYSSSCTCPTAGYSYDQTQGRCTLDP